MCILLLSKMEVIFRHKGGGIVLAFVVGDRRETIVVEPDDFEHNDPSSRPLRANFCKDYALLGSPISPGVRVAEQFLTCLQRHTGLYAEILFSP